MPPSFGGTLRWVKTPKPKLANSRRTLRSRPSSIRASVEVAEHLGIALDLHHDAAGDDPPALGLAVVELRRASIRYFQVRGQERRGGRARSRIR
jgi:hypothetical protein